MAQLLPGPTWSTSRPTSGTAWWAPGARCSGCCACASRARCSPWRSRACWPSTGPGCRRRCGGWRWPASCCCCSSSGGDCRGWRAPRTRPTGPRCEVRVARALLMAGVAAAVLWGASIFTVLGRGHPRGAGPGVRAVKLLALFWISSAWGWSPSGACSRCSRSCSGRWWTRGFITPEGFVQAFVLGQVVPGPNMAMCPVIGWHVAGLAGAVVAFVGIYSGPVAIMGGAYAVLPPLAGRHLGPAAGAGGSTGGARSARCLGALAALDGGRDAAPARARRRAAGRPARGDDPPRGAGAAVRRRRRVVARGRRCSEAGETAVRRASRNSGLRTTSLWPACGMTIIEATPLPNRENNRSLLAGGMTRSFAAAMSVVGILMPGAYLHDWYLSSSSHDIGRNGNSAWASSSMLSYSMEVGRDGMRAARSPAAPPHPSRGCVRQSPRPGVGPGPS